jgi:hypothetical protein
MGFVLSLLTHKWAGSVATALLVIVAALAMTQCSLKKAALSDLKGEREAHAKTKTNLATCKGNEARAHKAAADANASVELVRREGERLRAVSRRETERVRSLADGYRKDARRILGARADGDRCEAARKLIVEEAG